MSIILNALRGGRAKRHTAHGPSTAQTDAVLHTLGYGRRNQPPPGHQLKRVLGLVALVVILGAGLWAAVIGITRAFLSLPQPVATEARRANASTGEDYFDRAMMYQRLGDFENALVGYRQVLSRDDLKVEAHNNLGVLYRDKGLLDDAVRHFERAIAIDPGYAQARSNLGVVYLGQRKFDMAATQFHAALAIDAKNLESMVNLSTVERETGRPAQARAWLTRALDADARNAEAHYNLGLMDDEAGSRPQALAHYRAFLQYGAADHPALVGEARKRIAELESRNEFQLVFPHD